MALMETYDSYGNQVHRYCLMDNPFAHYNDIAYQYMVHFHIETYSKGTLCQLLPHLFFDFHFQLCCIWFWMIAFFSFIFKCKMYELKIYEWFFKMNDNEFNRTPKNWAFSLKRQWIKFCTIDNETKEWHEKKSRVSWIAHRTKEIIKSTYYKNVHPKNLCNRIYRRSRLIKGCNHHCYSAIHQIGNDLNTK